MDAKKFIETVYLGDRYCMETEYNQEKQLYSMKMNSISRVRSKDGNWNYYTDEDIEEGWIVFGGVMDVIIEIENFQLNDEIYNIDVGNYDNDYYKFFVNGSCADDKGYIEGTVEIIAKDIYLIDPKKPQQKIR